MGQAIPVWFQMADKLPVYVVHILQEKKENKLFWNVNMY